MYLLFIQDHSYDQDDLDDHLHYLRKWGGTPDFFHSTDTLDEAVDECRAHVESFGSMVIVEDGSYDITTTIHPK